LKEKAINRAGASRGGKPSPSVCVKRAMNTPGHGEEQSDVTIQLDFQMNCHARQTRLAMTKPVSSLAGTQSVRLSSVPRVCDGDAAIHQRFQIASCPTGDATPSSRRACGTDSNPRDEGVASAGKRRSDA